MQFTNECLISRFLDIIENNIFPKTQRGVDDGHKIFGAAILLKKDLSLVLAETNHENECPLWHGEIYTIKKFYEMPEPPNPSECIFLSTHEPCSMCLSALAWSGFPLVYFLFTYDETKDDFEIPDDLKILRQIFKCSKPARKSEYLELFSIIELLKDLPDSSSRKILGRIEGIKNSYVQLSNLYQAKKDLS
ncbi:MAG: nucleoside deaminase [Desulfobacterales bacterium]|nr:nucleoside deaminase [Desulfobacterales bacterium]